MTISDRIDPLTGLLSHAAIETMRHGSAIATVDLIGFRERINEPFGLDMGDHAIRTVAQRLRVGLAPLLVYRFGGDEFMVEIDTPMDRQDAERLAVRIIDLIAAPIDGLDRPIEADVGISLRRIGDDVLPIRLRAEWAQGQARKWQIPFVIEGEAGEVWMGHSNGA